MRRLVAPDNTQDSQWLKMDHPSRFIENHSEEWQFLFNANSELTNSTPVLKSWAKFDDATFNNLKITGYLYDSRNGSTFNSASCTFKIFLISTPDWVETLLTTLTGSQLPNSYYYVNPTLSSIGAVDFQGGDSLMIETTIMRAGITYRDRIYVNHLGIYDNVTRLRGDVEFLNVTKKDL